MTGIVVSQIADVVITTDPTSTTLVATTDPGTVIEVPAQGPQGIQGPKGDTGAPGAPGAAGLPGPAPTAAQIVTAVEPLVGAASGLAGLDGAGRQPLAQDAIRAWQVARSARSVFVAAGGSWSNFLGLNNAGNGPGNPDSTDGSYEAVQGGTPAPIGGVLASLITTYLTTQLGQTPGQAANAVAAIWAAALAIAP